VGSNARQDLARFPAASIRYHPTESNAGPMLGAASQEMTMNGLQRFMGGSPGQVLLRLIVISLIVGIVLSALGISPYDIVQNAQQLVRRVWNMGFGAIEWIWQYFLLGAVIVIPVWIVIRLLNMGKGG